MLAAAKDAEMRNGRNLVIFFAAAFGLLLLAAVFRQWALPQNPQPPDNIHFMTDYELSGVVDDALVVVAETARLAPDSRVKGDAALVGRGGVQVDGQIDGSLTVMGDHLVIGPDARVAGDVAFMGGTITIEGTVEGSLTAIGSALKVDPEAAVTGEIIACVGTLNGNFAGANQMRRCGEHDALEIFAVLRTLAEGSAASGLPVSSLAGSFPAALGLAALSALALAVFPRRFAHIEQAVRSAPRHLVRAGCLALLAVFGFSAGVVLLLALAPPLGLVLLPVGLLLLLALLLLAVTGWITLALLIGRWLTQRLAGSALPPLVVVLFGGAALLVVGYVLALLPFGLLVDLMCGGVLAMLGLGAVLVTRGGTRPARRRALAPG
ncbi:MAG: polymer-forming cytoskeletal protein [Chloroflexi bacterium]|nr:polymer-forming cytoskeletal protein [Chloroflexota bacterium]MDL1884187.1 polymer-forming cytoskeletal protein [Anaerolineae bacterium CFX8]